MFGIRGTWIFFLPVLRERSNGLLFIFGITRLPLCFDIFAALIYSVYLLIPLLALSVASLFLLYIFQLRRNDGECCVVHEAPLPAVQFTIFDDEGDQVLEVEAKIFMNGFSCRSFTAYPLVRFRLSYSIIQNCYFL